MLDKIAFMETLHSVQEVARTSLTPLSKDEIQTYFKDMELTKEQEEMVYQYLSNPQEDESVSEVEEAEAGQEEIKSKEKKISARFQMYLDEIEEFPILTEEQEMNLYERLAEGEEKSITQLSNQWLKRVVEIAAEYEADNLILDDIVQEGNIGLVMGLNYLLGKQEMQPEIVLKQNIKEAIECYIEEEGGEGEQENTILAKVSLVHEAAEALARELGSEPSIGQLAEYTKISEEEISDIISLAKKVKKNE